MAAKGREGHSPGEPGPGHCPPEPLVPDSLHFSPEPLFLPRLPGEGLDDLNLGEDLLGPGHGLCQTILDTGAQPPDPSAQKPAHHSREGNGHQWWPW